MEKVNKSQLIIDALRQYGPLSVKEIEALYPETEKLGAVLSSQVRRGTVKKVANSKWGNTKYEFAGEGDAYPDSPVVATTPVIDGDVIKPKPETIGSEVSTLADIVKKHSTPLTGKATPVDHGYGAEYHSDGTLILWNGDKQIMFTGEAAKKIIRFAAAQQSYSEQL